METQSSDRESNISETSFTQGNAFLVSVSEKVDNIFDRNSGIELTEPSQISNEIEGISQRLNEQNITRMSEIEKHLNSKVEETFNEIRASKTQKSKQREEDAEKCRPGFLTQKTKFSVENTHQILKLIKIKVRIITSDLPI